MDKEIIKEVIKEMFRNDEIRVMVNIEPEYAEKGSGCWNSTKTMIFVDGEKVYEHEGNVEIIEGE